MVSYSTTPERRYAAVYEPSLGDLLSDLSQETRLLARQEMALAKAEMREKTKEVGLNATEIAIGATLANAGVLALVASAILGLSLVMEAWLAALIVGLAVLIIGGLLAWSGIQALKSINPVPEQTIEQVEEDIEWISRHVRQ